MYQGVNVTNFDHETIIMNYAIDKVISPAILRVYRRDFLHLLHDTNGRYPFVTESLTLDYQEKPSIVWVHKTIRLYYPSKNDDRQFCEKLLDTLAFK
jgi:hypothetical protein